MASIRRTLSPVPRSGSLLNNESVQVSSPLSRSSSNSPNYASHGSALSSSLAPLDYVLYKAQNFFLGLLLQHPPRPFDRSKLKGQFMIRGFFHFLMCFFVGIFIGLTPFVPLNFSDLNHSAFNIDLLPPPQVFPQRNDEASVINRSSVKENVTSDSKTEVEHGRSNYLYSRHSFHPVSDDVLHDLLIIVTPTQPGSHQSYYLNHLEHTLKLIPAPLLWIVVEMDSQSQETAELLRNSGVMYRHLACTAKNLSESTNINALLRNVALLHIETHSLDGIVYFADDSNTYSTELFQQVRKISRLGVWRVAKLMECGVEVSVDGPICNGSQVIGWHLDNTSNISQRFHADISGFAFNSTILWDTKRWQRPTIEPIRQLVELDEDSQASRFVEQIVEDESQMECFTGNSSEVMVWKHIPFVMR